VQVTLGKQAFLTDPRAFGEAGVVKVSMARFVGLREIERAVGGVGEDIRDAYDLFHAQSLRSPPNIEAAAYGPTTPIAEMVKRELSYALATEAASSLPVTQRVLYYAQTIDPEIPYSKPAAHRHSIAKSGRHVAVLDPGQMVLQPAYTVIPSCGNSMSHAISRVRGSQQV
jgi:hypothetical protein